ncbi:uncharacterized protein LOC119913408 [Micropterus salmoides]|uniref:uncharacterized protein LOC119913408 n=1 Tax=Micropterus salmoides TaxID=27706 RepID=UPI0018EC4963|nr:uncharacterized protein LOC119913408 [Micropterus salmoides]
MEQKKRKTPSPFSAGYNVDSCKKAGDTAQAKKEGLNEDGNESLDKKIQTSFSEKQTAEEKCSEKDELPSKSVLRRYHEVSVGSASPSSCRKSIIRPYVRLPPHHLRQQNISSAQSVHDTVRHQSQRSRKSTGPSYNQLFNSLSPVCSSKTQGEVGKNTDELLPTTTAHHDPDIEQYDTSLPSEPSHEMLDSSYLWNASISAPKRSLSVRVHYLPYFSNPSIRTPFSAEYTGSCKKTGDAQQTVKEELNEYINEPFIQHLGSQTSISDKPTAEKKFSEEGVWDQLPNKRVHSLPRMSSSASASSSWSLHDDSRHISGIVNQDITRELIQAYGKAHFLSAPSPVPDQILQLPNNKDTEDGGPRFSNSSFTVSPQNRPAVLQEDELGDDSDVLVETAVPAVNCSVTNTQPTHPPLQTSSSCLRRSHSVPSLSVTTSAKNKTFTRSKSLPDLLFKPSCEEFTPDITVDENDETYRFQCSCPGLYQCSVTGLLFHMEGEGDVVYRIVPWNRRLLARHHKQPAGPLFDIKCLQQSVCRLHLPHCEIRSTGGGEFLSVAHVNDEGIEFIGPQKITETHVVINITGFSGFGNVKDEDSPAEPVRALVLLFYRPPADPDAESLLNVLLLPRNVVLRDVLRTRKKLVGDESYIETSPHCKLQPKQEYTLSTCPAEDSVLVQPTEAEFDCDNYDNFFPSFQVILETMRKHVKLFLRDTNSSHSVWERRVCLTGVKRSCGPSALNLSSDKRLLDIRSSFIEGISGPVLTSLLDKLFEKTVIAEAERESADEMQNRRDKAGFVIDAVRKKGEAASSEMIEFLCEADPFLCEHLGLI